MAQTITITLNSGGFTAQNGGNQAWNGCAFEGDTLAFQLGGPFQKDHTVTVQQDGQASSVLLGSSSVQVQPNSTASFTVQPGASAKQHYTLSFVRPNNQTATLDVYVNTFLATGLTATPSSATVAQGARVYFMQPGASNNPLALGVFDTQTPPVGTSPDTTLFGSGNLDVPANQNALGKVHLAQQVQSTASTTAAYYVLPPPSGTGGARGPIKDTAGDVIVINVGTSSGGSNPI